MSAGEAHTCATVGDGVKCWGDNAHGQLGVGDGNPRGVAPAQMGDNLPFVALGPGDQVRAVAAGGTHSCALLITGQVKCWGDNFYGQLGVGDRRARGLFHDDLGAALPAVNLEQDGALAISAGRAHTCALLPSLDGTVMCWGDNRFGQLGVGDRVARGTGESAANDLVPIDLGSGGGIVAISSGANHSCALLSSGAVKCWGANEEGQLGQGDVRPRGIAPGELGEQLNPVDLGPGRIATAVAAGGAHTCALLDDGAVKCWGANSAGQLGIGATDNRGSKAGQMGAHLPAVELGPGRSALAIVVGAAHSCALLSDGLVKCWGANLFGQLALGDTQNRGGMAAELAGQPPLDVGRAGSEALRAELITASSNHTCALLMNGEAKCWGSNAAGQLGQGDRNNRGDGAGELGDGLAAIRLVGPAAP
ncbi:MAG: hypothetical protein QOI66_3465 [Myxococcales bacterium]|jgi:alpha-tubulin suppressor-like RCC1 family protein|nr:hypothetical protein [Myxococcales bacterium]